MKRTKCLLSTRKLISLAKITECRGKDRKQWSKEMEAEAAGTAILIVTEGDFSQKEKG